MTILVNGINCQHSDKEEVAANKGEKDCKNKSLSLIKIKFTTYSNILYRNES